MAGDGSHAFTDALGLAQDLTKNGMGIRSKRFAIVVDDLVVKYVGVSVGGAESVLAKLNNNTINPDFRNYSISGL
jgi:peroxiredoxin